MRANGEHNPDFASTYVFTNDFSALRPGTKTDQFSDGLLRAEGEEGACHVLCFSPRHDLTLARMAVDTGMTPGAPSGPVVASAATVPAGQYGSGAMLLTPVRRSWPGGR